MEETSGWKTFKVSCVKLIDGVGRYATALLAPIDEGGKTCAFVSTDADVIQTLVNAWRDCKQVSLYARYVPLPIDGYCIVDAAERVEIIEPQEYHDN